MKNNKIEQLIKEIAAREPDEPEIGMVGSHQFLQAFSVLLSHAPKVESVSTREVYAENLKNFGLEKDSQLPWSMKHTRVIPKKGSISYSVHFYSLKNVEVEITTEIGTKVINSKLSTTNDLKQAVEEARLALRAETKEVQKILNMIDDPKLKAIYGAA